MRLHRHVQSLVAKCIDDDSDELCGVVGPLSGHAHAVMKATACTGAIRFFLRLTPLVRCPCQRESGAFGAVRARPISAQCRSIIRSNAAAGNGPSSETPFTKKPGVPKNPNRRPSSRSASTMARIAADFASTFARSMSAPTERTACPRYTSPCASCLA